MKTLRIAAIARKEWKHILRDPRSLGMAIAIPMLLLALFGSALTLDVDRVPLAVWDQSVSPASRELIARFAGSRYFSIRTQARNYAEIERALDERAALLGLVVPVDFGRRIASGEQAALQLIADGSDSNSAGIALQYADAVALAYSRDVAVRYARRVTNLPKPAGVDLRARAWFNPDLRSRNYIIPGLIAVIMAIIAALLTSLTIAREWENGTMEQLLSTPVRPGEIILGKLLPYFALGMLDVLLAVIMGGAVFGVPLRGSAALLFAAAAVFLAGALSLGMVISIITRSQLLASQLAMVVTFLPSFLLSGFVYSIGNMPLPVRAVTRLVPARYFVAILKGIYLKGAGLRVLGVEAGFLALFGAAILGLANLKFKSKLS
ncbi:MAG: ABC transporter permease [Acidobacteriia bacterium]|nr:ABC transporter permease [Terriglobia bacterium]